MRMNPQPLTGVGVVLLALIGAAGCGPEKQAATPPPAPAPTYTGEAFLQGTIGSVARLDQFEPILVSGYGLVVGLNETGSSDSPQGLRTWMRDEISKRGFGRYETGFREVSPDAVLASRSSAMVVVEGVVPPGATKGTKFDLVVAALPQTSTTSLVGGRLYSTDLHPGVRDMRPPRTLAVGAGGPGDLYLNPFVNQEDVDPFVKQPELLEGYVIGGGVLNQNIPIRLVTNQASYRLTSMIANRINDAVKRDNEPVIAVAKSDTLVELTVIPRFRERTDHMLNLISHLSLDPSVDFAIERSGELASFIQDPANEPYVESVSYMWEGFGNVAVPVARDLYEHPMMPVRMAALRAGARLGDARVSEPLFKIASGTGETATVAARLLGELLQERPTYIRLVGMLRQLLDGNEVGVRVAAFETLAKLDDASIQRFGFGDGIEVAQVRCTKPLIYVTQERRPRIVVFNDQLAFNGPLLFAASDNRFMLSQDSDSNSVSLFYQKPGERGPIRAELPSNVGYLLGVMAYEPTILNRNTTVGLGMSYSQIVRLVHQMQNEQALAAPVVYQESRLAQLIKAQRQELENAGPRPEREETAQPTNPQFENLSAEGASAGVLGDLDSAGGEVR